MSSIIWPEVFTDPDFQYDTTDPKARPKACADGLTGWGCCKAGKKPPEGFGNGMVKIASLLNIPCVEDELHEYARKFLASRKGA